MKLESVVIAFQQNAVNTSLLLAHTARQTTRVGNESASFGGVRIWALQGGLSRNKVAVGESAAGSPPNVIVCKRILLRSQLEAENVDRDQRRDKTSQLF